jgi:eukaryotic-like serine/threonine-protein kinase
MAASLRALSEAPAPRAESPTTIVLPSPEAREPRGGLTLDGSSLSTIERRLAHDIGPMASYHLRRALARAQSTEELCEQLAEALPDGASRTRFIREVSALLSASSTLRGSSATGAPGSLDLDAATLTRMTRALAAVMGPIAPRLIARAQARATSLEHMEELCTGLIPRPEERTAFRRLLREGGGT